MKLAACALLATCLFSEAPAKEPKGQLFAAVSALYAERLGGGLGIGYQWKSSGIFLLAQATYTYAPGVDGTVPFRCYQVPFHTGDTGRPGVALTVAIPLKGK